MTSEHASELEKLYRRRATIDTLIRMLEEYQCSDPPVAAVAQMRSPTCKRRSARPWTVRTRSTKEC